MYSVRGERLIPAHCFLTNVVKPIFSQIPAYAGLIIWPLYIYEVKIGSCCAPHLSDISKTNIPNPTILLMTIQIFSLQLRQTTTIY